MGGDGPALGRATLVTGYFGMNLPRYAIVPYSLAICDVAKYLTIWLQILAIFVIA